MSPAYHPQRQAVGRTEEGDFHLQKLQYGAEQPGVHPLGTERGEDGGVRPTPAQAFLRGLLWRWPFPLNLTPFTGPPNPNCHLFPWGPIWVWPALLSLETFCAGRGGKVGSTAFPSLIRGWPKV